ncbi:MAG: M48 family metalloprotease [Desulfatitalea sp.]|nr:M48 family metalloprotease [Desulfatitalea sp.]NNK01743.1 M48 family metalloprotease [Desulfatitalea sp.]
MHRPLTIKMIGLTILALHLLAVGTPARAISIREEEELSKEFMRVLYKNFDLVEDPLIMGYVDTVGKRILAQLPPQPFAYHFFVIREDVYNAFAIPAGYIFINSGLLLAMDTEAELAGILSHEISHVVCRHISQRIEREKKIGLASMAGMVAGIFLGAAGGSSAAAQAIVLSQAAGQSASLKFSRDDETQADQLGLGYLNKAGYTADGLLQILKKIRNKQWFGSEQIPTYVMTHPAVEERITTIDSWITTYERGDKTKAMAGPASDYFKRMQYRLRALYDPAQSALQYFQTALDNNPTDTNAAYGYALALSRTGNYKNAVIYMQKALFQDALDPVLLGDLGRLYFLDGRLEDALRILQGAASLGKFNPLATLYLGRTYINQGKFTEAAQTLESLINQYKDLTEAYYFMGETCGKLERMPEAHFYLGLYHFRKADLRTAFFHLERARTTLTDTAKLEIVNQALKSIGKLPPKAVQAGSR